MRMWMVDPRILCRSHLLGEHSEIHKHRHVFVKGWSIEGRRGQIEPAAMKKRHDALAVEMAARGYKHESPYKQPDLSAYDLKDFVVDRRQSMSDLEHRCGECKKRKQYGK